MTSITTYNGIIANISIISMRSNNDTRPTTVDQIFPALSRYDAKDLNTNSSKTIEQFAQNHPEFVSKLQTDLNYEMSFTISDLVNKTRNGTNAAQTATKGGKKIAKKLAKEGAKEIGLATFIPAVLSIAAITNPFTLGIGAFIALGSAVMQIRKIIQLPKIKHDLNLTLEQQQEINNRAAEFEAEIENMDLSKEERAALAKFFANQELNNDEKKIIEDLIVRLTVDKSYAKGTHLAKALKDKAGLPYTFIENAEESVVHSFNEYDMTQNNKQLKDDISKKASNEFRKQSPEMLIDKENAKNYDEVKHNVKMLHYITIAKEKTLFKTLEILQQQQQNFDQLDSDQFIKIVSTAISEHVANSVSHKLNNNSLPQQTDHSLQHVKKLNDTMKLLSPEYQDVTAQKPKTLSSLSRGQGELNTNDAQKNVLQALDKAFLEVDKEIDKLLSTGLDESAADRKQPRSIPSITKNNIKALDQKHYEINQDNALSKGIDEGVADKNIIHKMHTNSASMIHQSIDKKKVRPNIDKANTPQQTTNTRNQ